MAQRGFAVKVAIGKPKGGLDSPSEIGAPPPGPPDAPPDSDDTGSGVHPDPAAVGFRQEGETCEACEYNHAGQCVMLAVPVGLTCSLFEGKEDESADMGGGGQPGGMPPTMGA
jgi:hypothetical protein